MTNEPQYEVDLERIANVPVAEGVHIFVVKDIEEGMSKNDNPMWTVVLACETPGETGKEVRMFLVLTQNARWKFELFLDAMNAPKSGSAVAKQFIGRKMRAQIVHEDYEGRPQPRIGEMYPVGIAPKATTPPATNPAVKKVTTAAKTPVKAKPATALPTDATDE
jgi:hypothetical protein